MNNSNKELLKTLARLLARLLVFPIFVLYRLHLMLVNRPEVIAGYSQAFALIPGTTGIYLRREFYRLSLRYCAATVQIGFGTVFSTADVELHEGVSIGNYCRLGSVVIADNTLIASGVSIISGLQQHERLPDGALDNTSSKETIQIAAECWIGEAAVVAANLGRGCNVAAGAVVLKEVPSSSSVIGNPSRRV